MFLKAPQVRLEHAKRSFGIPRVNARGPLNGLRGLSVAVRCAAPRRRAPRRGEDGFRNPFIQITHKGAQRLSNRPTVSLSNLCADLASPCRGDLAPSTSPCLPRSLATTMTISAISHQSRSRPLGEQTWKAEDIAETIALTLSPVREATSEGFRALKIW